MNPPARPVSLEISDFGFPLEVIVIRTVSLLPAATEIVGALGLMDQLLAVSHECDYPEEANHLPRVTHCEIYGKGLPSAEIDRWVAERLQSQGSLYTLDEAKLRELAPDLILTQRLCDVCAPAYGSVAALANTLPSQPRLVNLEPKSLRDILQGFTEVAAAMGHPEKGDDVVGRLDRRIEDVKARVEGFGRPTAFIMEWAEPIYNSGHWNPELIRLAGGTPVLSTEGHYSVRVLWENLRAADPEVLIIACCGHAVERTRRDLPLLEGLPGWRQLRAVRNRRTYLADGSAYFSRPGPRIVDTLEMLGSVLHSEVSGGSGPEGRMVAVYS
jgi:iron complex transport system substrate-binding protein